MQFFQFYLRFSVVNAGTALLAVEAVPAFVHAK